MRWSHVLQIQSVIAHLIERGSGVIFASNFELENKDDGADN